MMLLVKAEMAMSGDYLPLVCEAWQLRSVKSNTVKGFFEPHVTSKIRECNLDARRLVWC